MGRIPGTGGRGKVSRGSGGTARGASGLEMSINAFGRAMADGRPVTGPDGVASRTTATAGRPLTLPWGTGRIPTDRRRASVGEMSVDGERFDYLPGSVTVAQEILALFV